MANRERPTEHAEQERQMFWISGVITIIATRIESAIAGGRLDDRLLEQIAHDNGYYDLPLDFGGKIKVSLHGDTKARVVNDGREMPDKIEESFIATGTTGVLTMQGFTFLGAHGDEYHTSGFDISSVPELPVATSEA